MAEAPNWVEQSPEEIEELITKLLCEVIFKIYNFVKVFIEIKIRYTSLGKNSIKILCYRNSRRV